MVAGVVTTFEPTTVDVRVQVAPGAPGVKIATACVVPFAMVAHLAAAKPAASNMKSATAFVYTFTPQFTTGATKGHAATPGTNCVQAEEVELSRRSNVGGQ